MTSWLIIGVVWAAFVALDMWLDHRFPCTCGRMRSGYFFTQHERAGVMMGRAIWMTMITAIMLVGLSWILGPLFALLATWHWRRWWFHEKDKLKKKAAKLAGVVGFNAHGKLVVKAEA